MSDTIVRPTFYEGEILPAADLVSAVDAARDQLARHCRYLRRWGIAVGLELQKATPTDAKTAKYVNVTVKAGLAIDGTGREIVLSSDTLLDPADFNVGVGGAPPPWYPVYLTGSDQPASGTSLLTGACGTSLPTQIKENANFVFGTPGSELNLDEQVSPNISDGPADGISSEPWLVLLGFVQWDENLKQFTDVSDANNGIGRRYVGVNAADVVSGSGTLQLATHPVNSPDAATIMALEIHESNNGELVFGKQNPDGSVAKVLTVSSKGDLTIAGKFSSAVKPGTIQVQSGSASDGMILPLPPGLSSRDQVDLHIHITPKVQNYPLPPGAAAADKWIYVPLECFVDDSRRVNCRIQWVDINNPKVIEASALCDYTIIASVPGV